MKAYAPNRREWFGITAARSAGSLSFRSVLARLGGSASIHLADLQFSNEANPPMNISVGEELDGRLFTNLALLRREDSITKTDCFYIRTKASKELPDARSWSIHLINGQRSWALGANSLIENSLPLGVQLMECAGNVRAVHFGMVSVARWSGVRLNAVLRQFAISGRSTQLLISGFDRYSKASHTSDPGASWIFSLGEIYDSGAFLATGMNGAPLTLDHGAPVRLVVPGYYGCCCIKWVNRIEVVDATAESTAQMREYASRTQQRGIPDRIVDYEPALIDTVAVPIRVEKWLVGSRITYRVVGLAWGGLSIPKLLSIQFAPEPNFARVQSVHADPGKKWTFWTHTWCPAKPGLYSIRLRLDEPHIKTRRLDAGYYRRVIEIKDV